MAQQNDPFKETLLEGENAAYIDMLYERYLEDPFAVEESWRAYFADYSTPSDLRDGVRHSDVRSQFRRPELFKPSPADFTDPGKIAEAVEGERLQVHVLKLINAYRTLGHLQADTNPLHELYETPILEELNLAHYGLDRVDPGREFETGDFRTQHATTLKNIYRSLRNTYTGSIGFEYMHIIDSEEKCWLQSRIESTEGHISLQAQQQQAIFHDLVAAETFERYLSTRYVGQKTFSLEGGEGLIPLLQQLIHHGARNQVYEMAMGMAHRGRLNVLVNVLGKPPRDLFDEFEGVHDHQGYAGDVKYHKGYFADLPTPDGAIRVGLAFNPSHLEIVSPVVAGHVRVRRDRRHAEGGDPVVAVLIHGDAAFAGQGVVMETLNMSQTRGYSIFGAIHIVINNQIGFTTSTRADSRSTYYPTDVAKMVNAPILHVNGDDPEAIVYAATLAMDYRLRFQKDIVIDLVCYRRRGHNEADEPSLTQGMMYKAIKSTPTTREKYQARLIEADVLSEQKAKLAITDYKRRMSEGDSLVERLDINSIPPIYQINWATYKNRHWTDPADTTYDKAAFKALAKKLCDYPPQFVLHDRLQKVLEARLDMADENRPVDWGFAENMAYATLLEEGYDVRLSGQDSGRGTFSHRHAVYHDQITHDTYTALQHLSDTQGNCLVINSLLSEEAVLAFEYGYATSDPDTLTIWEAQFGDFANGAQVVIDQFISSGEQKWGRLSGLVMLLPHGYEGMGAEHSSGRLERYLQLCAEHNMQICIPSTPMQIYHLLRRQMIRPYRKPLIVFTPKSLLRHPRVVSTLDQLCFSAFHPVLNEEGLEDKEAVTRIIVCAGKVYYDLLEAREKHDIRDIALLRIEQLYPFPKNQMKKVIAEYPNFTELVWCQEEPLNQGAWDSIKHRFRHYDDKGKRVFCVSRPSSAAAAVGSAKVHLEQQQQVLNKALRLETRYEY